MTLRIPAKVLLHVWSYDFYDMTLSIGKQRRHMINCCEGLQRVKILWSSFQFIHFVQHKFWNCCCFDCSIASCVNDTSINTSKNRELKLSINASPNTFFKMTRYVAFLTYTCIAKYFLPNTKLGIKLL